MKHFAFFNDKVCAKVLRAVAVFLIVDTSVTSVICAILIGLHTAGGNAGLYMTYLVNTILLAIILLIQTLAQNYWIVRKLYQVSITLQNVEGNKAIFDQLNYILASLAMVDLYYNLTRLIVVLLLVGYGTSVPLPVGYGTSYSLAYNPFVFSFMATHLAILTLTAHKLKNTIKPTIEKGSIQLNSSAMSKTDETGGNATAKLKSSKEEDSTRNDDTNSSALQ